MSRWTHVTCTTCWKKMYPGKEPIRLRHPTKEACCYCDATTYEGIYTRFNPKELSCRGEHEGDG